MGFRRLFCIAHDDIGAATAVVLANGLLMIFGIINVTRVHMNDAKWQARPPRVPLRAILRIESAVPSLRTGRC